MERPRLKPTHENNKTEKKAYQLRKQEEREAVRAKRDYLKHRAQERQDERNDE